MKKLVFVFAFALTTAVSMAQTPAAQKIGYADVEYIFSKMPEAKQIESDLQGLQAQLKKQYDTKYAEFQTKLKTYQDNINNPNIPDAVKQNSARELEQLQANLQKLQEDSQADLQKRNSTLLGPVQEKVGKAIEDVAKENGFSLILNNQISGLDVILFGDEKLDVSDLVLKKMGVNTAPETQTPAANNTTAPKKQP
jgi:outer membrane protein